jgi:hypothetical protein
MSQTEQKPLKDGARVERLRTISSSGKDLSAFYTTEADGGKILRAVARRWHSRCAPGASSMQELPPAMQELPPAGLTAGESLTE